MIPRVQLNQSELLAVPAVHNRSVFAELMNRICRTEATRPAAVAVELSQDSVDAVVAWFKELGVGLGGTAKFPCMLGLAKPNRRIHPRRKQAALRLQELYGKPLHEINPEVLQRELNFAPVSLLCLTATDSIIEGIRSAVELGLPVFGIDLGEVANGERGLPLLQDPALAQHDLAGFVARNDAVCFPHRDLVVDERREQVMAARLKRLLLDYPRVVFTCGIGHWHSLRGRLSDPAVTPATTPVALDGEQLRRVVVAPSLAIFQMDVLPGVTLDFEAIRSLPPDARERKLDFAAICRQKLVEACAKADPRQQESIPPFLQYLSNLSLLDQSRTPGLFTILNAAHSMVSVEFARHLGDCLVTQALDWARPDQWPGLPYLRGSTETASDTEPGLQAEVEERGRVTSRFFIRHRLQSGSALSGGYLPPFPDPPTNDEGDDGERLASYSWVWPPCETLLFSTAYAAGDIVDRRTRERCPEPFSGSLHEGVDVKATLRAQIRGEKGIQVKAMSNPVRMDIRTEGDDEPTVFIFENEAVAADGRWNTLVAGGCDQIREFVHNRRRFDQVTAEKGRQFVATIQFAADREPDERVGPHVSGFSYLYGITIFGNPSLNHMQSARWLESCNYTGLPIVTTSGIDEVFRYYQHEHRLTLERTRWAPSLMKMALPFAKRRVTVLLPKSQKIDPAVAREAARRRITIECLPLTHFPRERIERIRNQYLVRPRDVNALEYPEEVEKAFGESPRRYLEQLPTRIRAQLEPPR